MKEFEATGLWYIPPDRGAMVGGLLRFRRNDGLRLFLNGSFSEGGGLLREKIPIIAGIVDGTPYGKYITLARCMETRHTYSVPGFSRSELHADVAFVSSNFLFDREDEFVFNGCSVAFDHLERWVGRADYEIDYSGDRGQWEGFALRYRIRERATLGGEPPVQIVFAYSSHQDISGFSFNENAYFLREQFAETGMEGIIEHYVRPLQNFLTFATDIPNAVADLVVSLAATDEDQAGRPPRIHVLYDQIFQPPRGEEGYSLRHDDPLLLYEEVRHDHPDLLGRWLDFHRLFAPFCNLYFSSRYSPPPYVNTKFVDAFIALRSLHRIAHGTTGSVELEAESLEVQLATALPEICQPWARWVLPTGHDLEFPAQFRHSLDRFASIIDPLIRGERDRFVERALAAYRSNLHRDPAANLADSGELMALTYHIEILIKAILLDQIGIPPDDASRMIGRSRGYRFAKSLS